MHAAMNMLYGVTTALLGFVLLVSASVQCQSLSDVRCLSPIAVTVESSRNQTGKWTTKVGLEHRNNSGPWLVKTDVCEGKDTIRITTTISNTGSPNEGLAAGYELFPGIGYYKFHPNGTTWPRARQVCAEEGTHLVVINSEKEADVMVQLFARFPAPAINAAGNTEWAWVGVHEMGVNGEYYTIFGDSLNTTGFTRWVPSQPDGKAVSDAVVTNRHSGGLGDAGPSWTASFICEMEL